MRILVGWDDEVEAETIALLLDVGDNQVKVLTDHDQFRAVAYEGDWNVMLMSVSHPSSEVAFETFHELANQFSDKPIVGAWHQGAINHLAKFISHGLHSHVMRDVDGDFMFLLTSLLEAAFQSIQAQRARFLAERLREEVESVRRLQESVIPADLPCAHGYKVVARYEPSQIRVVGSNPVVMAGGDYYDVFATSDQQLIMLVGDASGHGVKACMSIMTMHTLIRMIRNQQFSDTADFVSDVNRRLCSNDIVQDEGGFITLLYSNLDTLTHEFHWTCAGQPMPLLQNLDTNEIRPLGDENDGGLPLAIDEDWEYLQCRANIPDRSRVLIYTDGLDEAFPADGDVHADQFGLKGIIASLQASREDSLEEALERLFSESNAATRGSGRHDDTSIVLLERHDARN